LDTYHLVRSMVVTMVARTGNVATAKSLPIRECMLPAWKLDQKVRRYKERVRFKNGLRHGRSNTSSIACPFCTEKTATDINRD
jgi:hypothetical protein